MAPGPAPPPPPLPQVTAVHAQLFAAFPDLRVHAEDLLSRPDSNTVAVHWTATGAGARAPPCLCTLHLPACLCTCLPVCARACPTACLLALAALCVAVGRRGWSTGRWLCCCRGPGAGCAAHAGAVFLTQPSHTAPACRHQQRRVPGAAAQRAAQHLQRCAPGAASGRLGACMLHPAACAACHRRFPCAPHAAAATAADDDRTPPIRRRRCRCSSRVPAGVSLFVFDSERDDRIREVVVYRQPTAEERSTQQADA